MGCCSMVYGKFRVSLFRFGDFLNFKYTSPSSVVNLITNSNQLTVTDEFCKTILCGMSISVENVLFYNKTKKTLQYASPKRKLVCKLQLVLDREGMYSCIVYWSVLLFSPFYTGIGLCISPKGCYEVF